MATLISWPAQLPATVNDLPTQVGSALGLAARAVTSLAEAATADGPLLLVLGGTAAGDAHVFPTLDRLVSARSGPTVFLVGDGWIGTDGPDVGAALVGASAVALARSIAVRRTITGRVNVVCVPERLVGEAGSQRGPLALVITSADIAEVVAFALRDISSYIDGQVLYANGGRQLFSSLTA